MLDATFLKICATHPLINKDEDSIKDQIESLKNMAILEIMAEVPDFWNRVTTSFTLPANTNVVVMDEKDDMNDYDHVKYLWTDERKLDCWTESKYRSEYPNGESVNGKPVRYVPLGEKNVLFSPTNTVDTTMKITYVSDRDMTLDNIPKRWHHVILYHVLQSYDDPEKLTYTRKYEHAMAIMKNYATDAEEEDIEIEPNPMNAVIANIETAHRSR